MRRRLFLNQLARAAALAPLARCAWGTGTNDAPGPRVAGFEFLYTTNWLARWQESILKEARTRYCDTELGETVAWLTAPFLNGFYYGYCATGDGAWLARLIDWADSWLKRGVKEPDGFIGWPKGTSGAADDAFLTDSMLGEATGLRPVVLMADKILKTPVLKDKFGSRAQVWLGLAEQVFEKWVARGSWREVKDGGLWVAPEFTIDRGTGRWASGYEQRNVKGFSLPANKENYIALWLLAMWDALQKPIYKQHAEKWFRLMKSRLRTHGEGKYYAWDYWNPAGPWDFEPNRAPRHWIGVHRNGSYQQMDLEGIVAAFEHDLVFTREDLRRFIATNRDLMWNQQFIGAKFQRVDGRLDDAGQKSWSGCLWPALAPYDESLRKVFVVNHDPGSWAGLDLTPWFRARLVKGFPPPPL